MNFWLCCYLLLSFGFYFIDFCFSCYYFIPTTFSLGLSGSFPRSSWRVYKGLDLSGSGPKQICVNYKVAGHTLSGPVPATLPPFLSSPQGLQERSLPVIWGGETFCWCMWHAGAWQEWTAVGEQPDLGETLKDSVGSSSNGQVISRYSTEHTASPRNSL